MKISEKINCIDFPCTNVMTNNAIFPQVDINPYSIKMLMISEAPSLKKGENFYESDNDVCIQPTIQIFNDAGLNISSIKEITDKGIYITTAIKCPKKEQSVSTDSIKNCSYLLEK